MFNVSFCDIKQIWFYISRNKRNLLDDLLDAWKDPLAITKRVKSKPFLNWKPVPKVVVILDGVIRKGTTANASFNMYRILKLQTTLPCLENSNISFSCSLLIHILQKINFVFVTEAMVFCFLCPAHYIFFVKSTKIPSYEMGWKA